VYNKQIHFTCNVSKQYQYMRSMLTVLCMFMLLTYCAYHLLGQTVKFNSYRHSGFSVHGFNAMNRLTTHLRQKKLMCDSELAVTLHHISISLTRQISDCYGYYHNTCNLVCFSVRDLSSCDIFSSPEE